MYPRLGYRKRTHLLETTVGPYDSGKTELPNGTIYVPENSQETMSGPGGTGPAAPASRATTH